MDEDMQRRAIRVFTSLAVIMGSLPMLVLAGSTTKSYSPAGVQQYCNDQYGYCVDVPNGGKLQAHEGDAPNHGATIVLPQTKSEAWTYAHWDAALLGSPQKVLLDRLSILLKEHPDAEVSIKPTTIAGMSAYRVHIEDKNTPPVIEELVIAYSRPENPSDGPGIIYEIGLRCDLNSYAANGSSFGHLVATFRRTPKK